MRWAIGDIHGCYKTMIALLGRLNLKEEDKVIFLGDYIDRGPLPIKVLDFMMQKHPYKKIVLRGNHEEFLREWLLNPKDIYIPWVRNGGQITIDSIPRGMTGEYFNFISLLPFYHEEPDYYCVHSSFSKYGSPFEDTEVMLWSRGTPPDMGKRIISGHTPVNPAEVRRSVRHSSWIRIDNGCVFKSHEPEFGQLVAFCLDNNDLIFQPNIDL